MNTQEIISHIIRSVLIYDDERYTICGNEKSFYNRMPYHQWSKPLSDFGNNTGSRDLQRMNRINQLSQSIYAYFYMTGKIDPDGETNEFDLALEISDTMGDLLSESNQTEEGIDYNWTIYAHNNGLFYAENQGELRQLSQQEVVQNTYNQPIQIGSKVAIKTQRENRQIQPQFYHSYSSKPLSQQAEIVRIYFNISPKGAPILLKSISEQFNRFRVPYSFKCLNNEKMYIRADSAVLYLDKRYTYISFRLLNRVICDVESELKDEIPLFTYKLYKGTGFAEDPGNGMSFGMSRCLLIAEVVLDQSETKKMDEAFMFDKIKEKFEEEGLSISRPFINPHSQYNYPFHLIQQ